METMIVKITLMKRTVNHWCASHPHIPVPTPHLFAFLLRSYVMAMMTVGMGLMKESCVVSVGWKTGGGVCVSVGGKTVFDVVPFLTS